MYVTPITEEAQWQDALAKSPSQVAQFFAKPEQRRKN
jgi:hypothetical protein